MHQLFIASFFIVFFNIQAQLVTILEHNDLFQHVAYKLTDECAEKKDDGLEILKELKKNIVGLLLTNKKIGQNMRLLIDEKTLDENKNNEIENPRSKLFFEYCMQKIAPTMRLNYIPGIKEDGSTVNLQISHSFMRKAANKFISILFCAHFAMPLAISRLKHEISDLSPKELEIALNIADHFCIIKDPPCKPVYTHRRKVGQELTRALAHFSEPSVPILLEVLLIPEAPIYFPGIFPHKINKHSQ